MRSPGEQRAPRTARPRRSGASATSFVALKWFHAEGEEEVEPARALLAGHRAHMVALRVLDLTPYELGNALLRGRLTVTAVDVAEVLDALVEICPRISPTCEDLHEAAVLPEP